ncbi:MAG: alpha/beta hydrolase [Acidimicrobiales bacterium]|jgi:pimeloyl-ACP methyl ester carboxylesterase
MPIASSDGVDLYYERRGVGPRLLFLNGSGSTIEGSGLLLGVFARPFDLVAWDYRGMGRSGLPASPYDMSQCARDALAVLDAVGWDTARVLGISFGGMVAQELAVTAPQRIERLALLCTSAGGEGGSSYPLHELERMSEDERKQTRRQLIDTRFDPEWLASHPKDRDLVDAMERRAPGPEPGRGQGNRFQLEARRHHDVWDRLPSISCPTYVACGRFDGIAPPGNSAALASQIAGSQLHTYEGGHAFLAQDPRSITDVIDFLEQDTEPGGAAPTATGA